MANININTTTKTLQFVTNDLADFIGITKSFWNINELQSIRLMNSPQSHVEVAFLSSSKWQFTHDGSFGVQIDNVNDVAVTSDLDLYDKLYAAIG